jgi:hypothetical protein
VPEDGVGLNRFVVTVRAIHAVLTILEEAQSASQRLAMEPKHLTHEQRDLVWRYVQVWRRFRRLADGYRSFASLEDDLAQGSGMFLCGLLVQTDASSVITADVKDPKFHTAIFDNDDHALADMTPQELQEARRYIIRGGQQHEASLRQLTQPAT